MAAAELTATGLIVLYVPVAILFGMIPDSASIMLILAPLVLPVLQPMGIDLIWFGVVTVIAVEIGLLTPLFGMSVYAIRSALDDPGVSITEIFAGAAHFALLMLLCLTAVIAASEIATGLR